MMDIFSHFIFTVAIMAPIFGFKEISFICKVLFTSSVFAIFCYAFLGMNMAYLFAVGAFSFVAMGHFLHRSLKGDRNLFILFCSLFGAIFLAGFSHIGDYLWILLGNVPSMYSPIRPQNLWHVPIFAFSLSLISIPILIEIVEYFSSRFDLYSFPKFNFRSILSATFLGYLFHIFTDSITYDFDIWWFYPFSKTHFSLYDLANEGILMMETSTNPWSWVYYYLTIPILLFVLIYVLLVLLIKKEMN